MARVARALADRVGLFDEAPGGGDWRDIDAPRNAPLKSPHLYLDLVHYHSLLNYLEVAIDQVVTINHAAVAAVGPPSGADVTTIFGWGGAEADWLLLNHNLGYIPPFFRVAIGSNILNAGTPVQNAGSGRMRYATVYATETQIRLFETSSRTSSTMAAASIDYRVLVCNAPPAPVNDRLIEVIDGVTMFSGRTWRSDRRYLQVKPGGTPFGIILGRAADAHNGSLRVARADGTLFEPVPATTVRITPGTGVYGPSLAYGGSFSAPATFEVQAP